MKIRYSSFILFLASAVLLAAAEPEFQQLFNGKDLTGWEGKPEYFSVKDGMIHAETTAANPLKKNTFLIYTVQEFGDFELRFDYKVVGGNSGMQYRSERQPDFVLKGYQSDFENVNRFTGMFFEENGRMFMAYPGEHVTVKPLTEELKAKDKKAKAGLDKVKFATTEEVFSHIKDPTGWHAMTIIARGNTFVHILDGRVMSVAMDEDAANLRKSGLIGLQLHQGAPMTVNLKNIRIRVMK
ncbi:MAG: 3-keto-disaccharide hydrolase [Verrucomicrobiota bacterium]